MVNFFKYSSVNLFWDPFQNLCKNVFMDVLRIFSMGFSKKCFLRVFHNIFLKFLRGKFENSSKSCFNIPWESHSVIPAEIYACSFFFLVASDMSSEVDQIFLQWFFLCILPEISRKLLMSSARNNLWNFSTNSWRIISRNPFQNSWRFLWKLLEEILENILEKFLDKNSWSSLWSGIYRNSWMNTLSYA